VHAWPARDFHTTYYGWTHGGTTDGALMGRKGYPPVDADILSAERQAAALRAADLPAALGLAGYRPIVHPEPLANSEIRTVAERHAPNTAPCYAELLIENIALQQDFFSGRFLNVLYRLRLFGKGTTAEWTFGTFATAKIAAPSDDKGVIAPEVLSAKAADAFAESLKTFGTAAQRARAHPARKH